MALLEKENMIGVSDKEPTTATHTPPSKDYLAQKEKEWNETSKPGDIFDMSTGTIKRVNNNESTRHPHIEIVTNLNDTSNDLLEEAEKNNNLKAFKPESRGKLNMIRHAALTLVTSAVK